VLFAELIEAVLEPEMQPIINDLLELKVNAPEMGKGKRIDKLNTYIDQTITGLKETIDTLPSDKKASWSRLNELFFSAIQNPLTH